MPTSGSIDLSAAEQRYCRCLVHVASKGNARNPYAICTASVYSKQGRKRGRIPPCSENYNFSTMKRSDLEGYAKLHKIKGYSKLSDEQLSRKLNAYVTSKYGTKRGSGTGTEAPKSTKRKFEEMKIDPRSLDHRNVWIEYVKQYRKDHPELTYKQSLVRAAKEYHAVKY